MLAATCWGQGAGFNPHSCLNLLRLNAEFSPKVAGSNILEPTASPKNYLTVRPNNIRHRWAQSIVAQCITRVMDIFDLYQSRKRLQLHQRPHTIYRVWSAQALLISVSKPAGLYLYKRIGYEKINPPADCSSCLLMWLEAR